MHDPRLGRKSDVVISGGSVVVVVVVVVVGEDPAGTVNGVVVGGTPVFP